MATEETFGELVPLGTGPTATVLAGMREGAGEAFALKVYPDRIDRRTRAQLGTELSTLTALRGHVPVLVADAVEAMSDGRLALRMELCAQSLTELVASFGPMSVPDVLALGESIAAALTAAHGAGIPHGGVTPGNVLFRPSGEAVLSDFGLTLRHAFPPNPELAAIDYLPPETLRDGSADERSDLYGLGAVLYLALSGTAPHHGRPGEQKGERVLRVLDDTPVAPLERPGVPPGLVQLISALLAKNPHARPLDTATVVARLGAVSGPTTVAKDAAFDDFGGGGDLGSVGDFGGVSSAAPAPVPTPEPPRPPQEPQAPPQALAGPPEGPQAPPQGLPEPVLGNPILEYGPKDKPKRATRTGRVLAGLTLFSLLAVAGVLALVLVNNPAEMSVPPTTASNSTPSTSVAPAPEVRLELLEPVDRGNFVELTWRSNEPPGGQPLDFAIIVAAEGQQPKPVYVRRVTHHRLPVDPVRKYCFQIRGVNSTGIYDSEPKPFRRATCVE